MERAWIDSQAMMLFADMKKVAGYTWTSTLVRSPSGMHKPVAERE
jgi:hypothetical protein